MVTGPPVLFADTNEKLLAQEIFASGMEPQPYLVLDKHAPAQPVDHDDINLRKKSMIELAASQEEGEDTSHKEKKLTEQDANEKVDGYSIKLEVIATYDDTAHQHHSTDIEHCHSFLSHLVSVPFTNEPEVVSFLLAIQQYSKTRGMVVAMDFKEGHPLETFGRVFMACLLKMLDMTLLAMKVAAAVMKQQEIVSLPLPLVEVNKLVYDTKVALVKVITDALLHQHTCTHVHTHTYAHAHTYTHTHAHTHTHTYTYTHTRTHMYVHTYTHITYWLHHNIHISFCSRHIKRVH